MVKLAARIESLFIMRVCDTISRVDFVADYWVEKVWKASWRPILGQRIASGLTKKNKSPGNRER